MIPPNAILPILPAAGIYRAIKRASTELAQQRLFILLFIALYARRMHREMLAVRSGAITR